MRSPNWAHAQAGDGSPPDDRDDVGPRDDRIGRRVRGTGQGVAGGEHAAHRPRQSARGGPRRGSTVAACPRASEEALRWRIRRHLLSARIRRPWVCPSSTSAHSTKSRKTYELPIILNTPTFTICAATILDTGSEEQKKQHISAALRGDEVLVQLLSEPSGGSDLAGVITRADRTGRQVGDQRREDLEHKRFRRRLRADAGHEPTGTCPSTRA